jgi:hypothetical protein
LLLLWQSSEDLCGELMGSREEGGRWVSMKEGTQFLETLELSLAGGAVEEVILDGAECVPAKLSVMILLKQRSDDVCHRSSSR